MRSVVPFALLLAAVLLGGMSSASRADEGSAAHGGWGWLVERLVADGLDRALVERTFDDQRLEPFDELDFGLAPRESPSLYRGFLRPGGVAAARRCRARYAAEFEAAGAARGVPPSLVAAILHIESSCGTHTGSCPILHRLARLAMADEPANLRRNLARLAPAGAPAAEAAVRARARYMTDTFYPEVRGVFALASRLGTDPLEIRGSDAGAFGSPQFLPTSYLEHGADGDGDGRVDLYDPADAALSCAAYLAAKGWRPGLSRAERRRVVWAYNHSDAYIDTVLALASALERPASSPVAYRPRRTVTTRKPGRRVTRQVTKGSAGRAVRSAQRASAPSS